MGGSSREGAGIQVTIGIGRSREAPPFPHHRNYGPVYGGSAWLHEADGDHTTHAIRGAQKSTIHRRPRRCSGGLAYDQRDRLLSEDSTNNANDASCAHDANGSQTTVTASSTTTHHLWDLRGRVAGIDLNGSGDALDAGETEFTFSQRRNNSIFHRQRYNCPTIAAGTSRRLVNSRTGLSG